jgi:hypothetical protein
LYPGKGVCGDPVKRGAILEGEGPGPPSGDNECQLSPTGEAERCDKMRRWQEVKEDYPFMASEREHAQSEFTCIAQEESVNILSDIVLIVSIVSGK